MCSAELLVWLHTPCCWHNHCAGSMPIQRLLSDPSFVLEPPVRPLPAKAPWGMAITKAAIELRAPPLLQWALQPELRESLWGAAPTATLAAVVELIEDDCSPISNAASRTPEQQQRDLQELQQFEQQLKQGCWGQQAVRPHFAQAAAETALLLLQAMPVHADSESVLCHWLQYGVRASSSAADLARAKAVVAAVASAKVVPLGARVLEREGMRQVLMTGDVDLLALVTCWAKRREVLGNNEGVAEGHALVGQ